MRSRSMLLLLVPLLHACTDSPPLDPHATGGPLGAISDARTYGNIPGAFLLPPILPQPAYSGNFVATLSPEVRVCELSEGSCTENIVASFSTTDGLGGEVITVNPTDEHYQVAWHTDLSNLDTTKKYRVQIYLGELLVAFADVQPTSTAAEFKNVDGETVPLKDGRTLPIKFRLEESVAAVASSPEVEACLQSPSCTIRHVLPNHPDGEQVVLSDNKDLAGVFANGFMDSYVDADPVTYGGGVTVVMYRTGLPCFEAYTGDQAEACSRRVTIPALEQGFDFPQRVEQCLDAAVAVDDFQLARFSLIGPEPERGRVVLLPRVSGTNVDCANFSTLGSFAGLEMVRRVLGPLLQVFAPASAYATDVRYGGMTTSYSTFGYVRLLALSVYSGDGQTATPGATLPVDPTVQVLEGVSDASHSPHPAEGVEVTFAVGASGGTLDGQASLTVSTDGQGFASVPWTLGTAAGTYELTATIAGGQPVTFTATATTGTVDLTFGAHSTSLTSPPYFQLWRKEGATWHRAAGTDTLMIYSSDDSVSIRAYFINTGTVDHATTFNNRMRFDATEAWGNFNAGTNSLLSTGTQGYNAITRAVTGPTSGCEDRVARAELDSGQEIAESDEADNFAEIAYRVCPPPIF